VEQVGLTLSPTPFALALRKPEVAISPSGPIELCPGDSILLTVTNPTPTYLYTWNTGQTGPTLWVPQPGTYFVVASIGTWPSCTDTAYVEVRRLPAPYIQIAPVSPQTICPGDSFDAYCFSSIPLLSVVFQWNGNCGCYTGQLDSEPARYLHC
jgi:hypothetical protein